ncbi:hypothetical protein [Aliivibrio sp. S2MY1]|uniref:hypothetical protein n=1 Tax=Aliivibrio TaxID=511678 RepID=UPI002379A759|nr:hypothetical protein [Aliivibrio sp. S2MY1]MDD9199531.1 hypothetical protein [Aliivibrio sp. S2MY1]
MGLYTEILLRTTLKVELDSNTESVLNFLFNNGSEPTLLPDHVFFGCYNWHMFGRCNDSSFKTISYLNNRHLFSRCDIKMVHDNIDKFIDWIEPYIDKEGEDLACIGWRWFEDDQKPELIFV